MTAFVNTNGANNIFFLIFFRQLLYFDRIKNDTVYPDRTMPTFKAWNDSLLRDRESQEMNSINFGSGELMPVIADQPPTRTDSQEEDEERGEENMDHNPDEEKEEEDMDHVVNSKGKRHAEKRKAPASQSSTDSGDSDLDEVTSTIYSYAYFTTLLQCNYFSFLIIM